MKTRKIAIADDDHVFRKTIVHDLCNTSETNISFCVSNGYELLYQLKKRKADMLLINMYMPFMSGIEAASLIRKQNRTIPILVCSTTYQRDMLYQLQQIDVNGYCARETAAISRAVDTIFSGGSFFDAAHYDEWQLRQEKLMQADHRCGPQYALKPLEIKIVALSCEGYTNKEIARELHLSPRTIDTYSTAILEKLGLRNKIEMVKYAFLNGGCVNFCKNATAGICGADSDFKVNA